MKYISYDRLREIITSCIAAKVYPGIWVLDECKELPDQQWQTIEEFKANPVEGWCYINIPATNSVVMRHYRNYHFYDNEDYSVPMSDYFITHVMPITTPEAPK